MGKHVSNPILEAATEAVASPPVVNAGWFLHSVGKIFGPVDEAEIRGYFRAGMIKASDLIAVDGQVGTVSAIEAAVLLGEPPPAAQSAGPVVRTTTVVVTQIGESSRVGGLLAVLALVAVIGIAYFSLHKPAELSAVTFTAPTVSTQPSPTPPAGEPPANATPAQAYDPFTANPLPTTNEVAPAAPALPIAAPSSMQEPSQTSSSDEWWSEASRLFDRKDWAALQAHAEKWTQAEPRRDLAWWYLGVATYWQGNYAATIDAASRAVAISPNYVNARWLLSDGYLRTQQWRKSLDILNDLADDAPNDARLWNDIGIDQANLGEYDEAVNALEKAVKLDPGYKLAWKNLAQAYARFGQLDKAHAAVDKVNSLPD
jgi:hypothetical protein